MPAPDGTVAAGMECVGHTDLSEEDILDLEEEREIAAVTDREIHGDDE